MTENIVDVDLVKNWYLQLWKKFVKLDGEYRVLSERRDGIRNSLNSLESILAQAHINVEDLRQGLELATKTEIEDVEPKILPDVIRETLQTSTRPMHYKDILHAMSSRGHVVPGKDPGNTLIAYMNRFRKYFAKAPEAGRGYYKLKEWERSE